MHAHHTQTHHDIGWTNLFLDQVDDSQCDRLSGVHMRAGRRPEAELDLPGIDSGENLGPELTANQDDDTAGNDQVSRDYHPPDSHRALDQVRVAVSKGCEGFG